MKNEKRTTPAVGMTTALMWRAGVLIYVLWLTAMSLITVVGAQQLQKQWIEHASQKTGLYISDREDLLPGQIEQQRILEMYGFDALGNAYLELPLYIDPIRFIGSYQKHDVSYETAMVFFENNEPVLSHGDYVTFEYVHANSWLAGKETPDGYAYIDLKQTPPETEMGDGLGYVSGFGMDGDVFRLTGYFEDHQFVLQELAGFSVNYPSLYEGKTLAQWDQQKGLNWQIHYENPQALERELVCIYTKTLNNYQYMGTRPVARLLLTQQDELKSILLSSQPWHSENHSLTETVIITERSAMTQDGTYHKVRSAVRCYPLRTAKIRLYPCYVISALLCFGMLVMYYRRLKKHLRDPLQQLINCGQQNMRPLEIYYCSPWKELYQLEEIYAQAQQELRTLRQENTQLKTTLDYAKNAEVSRRQLVSDMTHELKTPLAVIRSYCEGLLTGIAPEKREQYLNVIIEEADRMDATVLEMLDLSRLEAGKVRLSQDRVELLGLTKSILDKLQPLVEVKELSVSFAIAEESYLTADEGRLGQVITNLVSNAIKYSPMGGKVILRVFQHDGFTYFTSENESEPLSEEALEKIWDSFYRAEQSRSTEGTGLGLSICKAIIELHGGSCEATNTATGIEFRFAVPM